MAVEEPAYEVVRDHGSFEVRRYAPMRVAETEVEGDFTEVGNRAFRVLAGYIGGANREARSIAMTAPVTQAGSGRRHVVGCVMPSSYTRETLPLPNDPRITIREVPSRLVAVARYSGTWSEERYREHEAALRVALAKAGYTAAGPPVFARYNPPFTPWFLRRNEVLVELARPQAP